MLVFDFASMKQQLELARIQPSRTSIPIRQLIEENTTFSKFSTPDVEKHFTQVQLEEINDVHIYTLKDRTKLKQYLLQTLPVDFDENFEYKKDINKQLDDNVPNFKAVKVNLQSDDADDEVVAKPNICNLQPPIFGFVETSDKQKVGYYWACLNKAPKRIDKPYNTCPDKSLDDNASIGVVDKTAKSVENIASYAGFLYKKMGFTIGDRNKLRQYFKAGSGTLYHWYTGEIYVIDSKVIPNAERDDFETSPAKTAFDIAVQQTLSDLDKKALNFQEKLNADEKIRTAVAKLKKIEEILTVTEPLNVLMSLDEVIKSAKRYKGKASTTVKEEATEIIKEAEKLQKRVRSDVDKRNISSSPPKSNPKPIPTITTDQTLSQGESVDSGDNTQFLETNATKNLTDILNKIEIADEDNFIKVIAVIDEALNDILDSNKYQTIVEYVETRLNDELDG